MIFPLSIGVTSSISGLGKTTFIENFIRFVKRRYKNLIIVAIKYTKTNQITRITKNSELIEQFGKDTERMKRAGADYVYWVQSPRKELEILSERLKHELPLSIPSLRETIIIMEGNSLVRFMQPDVIIFFKGDMTEQIKPSGKDVLDIADIIIEKDYKVEEIMSKIEEVQQKKLIEKLLKERTNDGRISCSEARKIAEELRVPYIEVGRMANELKIKIKKCELGCF